MPEFPPFIFHTERRLVRLTGRKAKSLRELAQHLQEVSGASIFYHTHHQYLSHHFERPRFHNDFALWTSRALLEYALAERLAAIDLFAFSSVRELREALLEIVETGMAPRAGERFSPPGDEFHFCESQSFIMPTGLVAHSAPEFFDLLPRVTNISLYFHLMEARLRLGRNTNDFSLWFDSIGEPGIAAAIDAINPYIVTMDQLKQKLTQIGRRSRSAKKIA